MRFYYQLRLLFRRGGSGSLERLLYQLQDDPEIDMPVLLEFRCTQFEECTAVDMCCRLNKPDIMQMLLGVFGCDPNLTKETMYSTSLIDTIARSNKECIEVL